MLINAFCLGHFTTKGATKQYLTLSAYFAYAYGQVKPALFNNLQLSWSPLSCTKKELPLARTE